MLVSTFNQEKALVKLQSSRMFVSSSSNYTPWLFLLQITFSAPHSGLTNLRVFIFFKFFFHLKKLRLIYFISRSRSSKHNATIAMLYAKSTKNIKKCFCTLKASSHKLPQLAICYTLQIPDVNIFPPVYLCVFSSDDAQDETRRDQEKLDLVELLEAVTYLVCQDQHVIPDTFYKVSITLLSIKSWEIFDNIWMRW